MTEYEHRTGDAPEVRTIVSIGIEAKGAFGKEYSSREEYVQRAFKPREILKPCKLELRLPTGKSITAYVDLDELKDLTETMAPAGVSAG